ncbi:MAG: fructosamine kinase family protein [Alteromonas sp.]|nr:fructosamine kinase family protein [Alteromonas sp.]
MWHFISEHISQATGQFFNCRRAEPVSGGDTHKSFVIRDETHRYFVKTRRYDDTQQLQHEAEGLDALAETNSIQVPQVICQGVTKNEEPNMEYLVLCYKRFVVPQPTDYFQLGEMLAKLHAVNAHTSYGWPHDNFIGASVQTNGRSASWADFFAEKRIGSMLERLIANNIWRISDNEAQDLIEYTRRLLSLHQPHPSLLHGDLWHGNIGFSKKGPVIFDPAVYVGDAETDLAMAELFGGFPESFFEGYSSHTSLEKNYQQRKPIYQLYHILNHGLLFGAHYIVQAKQIIDDIKRTKYA